LGGCGVEIKRKRDLWDGIRIGLIIFTIYRYGGVGAHKRVLV
jgi:hypothetical protein